MWNILRNTKHTKMEGRVMVVRSLTQKEVLPGIEPGLPEDTEVIRIRSDNRYLLRISD